ncbi:MAG: HD domain-containing protein [Deltaproteobacteria bacterium]|nr:HD domain-containing protein [Deltaproteobacteria bacterium]
MAGSEKFRSVSLHSITPGEPLPFRVAIFYKGKHLVFRKPGQQMEVAIYNKFVYRQIHRIFIPEEDFAKYLDYQKVKEEAERSLLQNPKYSPEQQALERLTSSVKALSDALFASEDLASLEENVRKSLEISKATVKAVLAKPYFGIYTMLSQKADTVANHSMRVSVLATLLGYQLGFVNPLALEQLAAAGILHDIGKTKLTLSDPFDESIPASEKEAMDAEIMKQHPVVSCDMLSKMPFVPQEVTRIIREHHESRDGTGYPNRLRGSSMYGLSKVFTIANTFDSLVSSPQDGDALELHARALLKMDKELRNQFDQALLTKALAFLTLKRP